MTNIETDKRKCKTCGQMKDRSLVGKFDAVNKKYTDGTGLWNGSNCPGCHRNKCKEQIKNKRSLLKSIETAGV